jgi:hypothetical protein
MIAFAEYLLKVIVCSAVFTGYYWLALRNKVFHEWNRFYLLAVVVISLLLPFVKITVFSSPAPDEQAVYQAIRTITTDDRWFEDETVAVTVKPSLLTAENIAAVLYMLFSLFAFLIFCIAVLKLVKLYKNHRHWTIQNGQTVRCRHEKIVTFRLPETEENQNKNTISVANATMKVLYLGLDNPLMVSGGDIPANKLILTTNNAL